MNYHSVSLALALALALSVEPDRALAHDPGLSTMAITVGAEGIEVRITLTREELALAFGTSTEATAIRAVEMWADGRQVSETRSSVNDVDDVELDLAASFPRPPGARRLRVAVPFIGRLGLGHRQYVTVSDTHGTVIATHLLSATDADLEFDPSNPVISR